MNKLLVKKGRMLPMTTDVPRIQTVDILIEGSTITNIGENLPEEGVDVIIDAVGKVVLPGFINCHNHGAMSLFRGYSLDLRLMEWLSQKIWPAEERLDADAVYWGTMLAAAEMIKSGTTTFADMYFFMDEVAQAVKDSGMRAALCQGLLFIDDQGERRLQSAQKLFENWQGKADGRITTMVGPHAPHTCPPDKLKEVMDMARCFDCPIHIHLAETVEEVEHIFHHYGKSPVKYLYDLGMFEDHHCLLAHAVNVSRDDMYLLRGFRGGISHNPVSNQKLGCGVAPVVELRKMGITVALGTDGAGSASTLDMFEEIKATAWMQKNRAADPTAIKAYDVLRMATIEGAKALGLEQEVGTIEVGKRADLILVDVEKPHLYPRTDICALLAYSANGADVDTVIIHGQVVMEQRRLRCMDEKEVLRKAQRAACRVILGQQSEFPI
ncbi:amidohydrolase [Heliobacterium mobile]